MKRTGGVVAEKPFLLVGAHPCASSEIEHKRGLESHDTERER